MSVTTARRTRPRMRVTLFAMLGAALVSPLACAREVNRCYRSPNSMLFGPATGFGQQGAGPGWLRLDSIARADSGTARFADGDGKALGARWRRVAGDSVHVLGFDDFLRVELHGVERDGVIDGRGTAHSDAALERDSTGRTVELRRAWRLQAATVSCNSMPDAGGAPRP